jgi:glycosyltransferase involved in cell wall biosynthesis
VVSPFLDNAYGTERAVLRWIAPLTDLFEIHVYSQRIEDLDLSRICWHRIPTLPGPHIANYIWWYFANQIWRAWDTHVRGLQPDIIYSPGINCPDADVISVHIVFAEFARQARSELQFRGKPLRAWPLLLHRRLYYRLIVFLERRIYRSPRNRLVLYAKKTAADLKRFYDRNERVLLLYMGLDHSVFNRDRRLRLRAEARSTLGMAPGIFVLLLVGNDLRKKGIRTLINAMAVLQTTDVRLLVVTRENSDVFASEALQAGLKGVVSFHPPRKDVDFYYAASDAYVGPSIEDTFAMPPFEAMAAGLPVIVSRENGTSEVMNHGTSGLILEDATDSKTLAKLIRDLVADQDLARSLGEEAEKIAKRFTWESNVEDFKKVFSEIIAEKVAFRS